MRDDFEITTAHIDLIADTAVRAGALGARMTGGGFGGCVIALVPAENVDAVGDAVGQATIRRTQAGPGAGPVRAIRGRTRDERAEAHEGGHDRTGSRKFSVNSSLLSSVSAMKPAENARLTLVRHGNFESQPVS